MKKIFLLACYIIAITMTSCTNDDVETTPETNTKQISADGDGDSGQIPTKPPTQ